MNTTQLALAEFTLGQHQGARVETNPLKRNGFPSTRQSSLVAAEIFYSNRYLHVFGVSVG